ncbi:uncharacterized protein [Miscanthus floridulus]|uniref:uncharacterized protein isoform X2 n=1 Tax=Miscanthus floridulus TaxID=154761 RepID=UPI00345B0922
MRRRRLGTPSQLRRLRVQEIHAKRKNDMSTPRDTRGAQSEMSTPRDTRGAQSDITNVTDEASRKREERNMQQRKRRADMSIEQREEINRKQQNDENAEPRDGNTPIILGNDNIQTDADGNQSHVGVGTSTTRGSALSVANGNDDPETIPADSVDTRREERNARQRKRRAEMTDQQREEINRKQREYRA